MARTTKHPRKKRARKAGGGGAVIKRFSETVTLSEHLDCRLTALARRRNASRAKVMREALAALIAHEIPPLTAGELVADLAGAVEGPGDLLANPKHMAGYGQPNQPGRKARGPGRKSLAQLFAESPLKGLDLKIERE